MQTPLRCAFCQPEDARTSDDARVLVPWMHIISYHVQVNEDPFCAGMCRDVQGCAGMCLRKTVLFGQWL